MKKLSAIEVKTINSAVNSGFTFSADAHFLGYMSAVRCIRGLERKGYLKRETNEYGAQYVPTQAARDFVTYGIAAWMTAYVASNAPLPASPMAAMSRNITTTI